MSNVDVKFRLKQRKLKETLFREGGMSTENVLITMRVHYLNMRLEFSTSYHADVACWDPESECVTCANRDGLSADEINGGLMRLARNIKSAARMYEEMEKVPTQKELKATFEKIRNEERKFSSTDKEAKTGIFDSFENQDKKLSKQDNIVSKQKSITKTTNLRRLSQR